MVHLLDRDAEITFKLIQFHHCTLIGFPPVEDGMRPVASRESLKRKRLDGGRHL